MAKITVAPKKVTKAASAAPTVDKKAVKEKQAADRLKLVESLVPELSAEIEAYEDVRKQTENKFFSVADETKALMVANALSKDETRQLVKLAMAEAYSVNADEITLTGQPTLYANLSKIMTLVIPKDKAAEKALEKARAKGVTTSNALLIARGKMLSAPVSGGKGKDAAGNKATKKNGRDVIEDEESLGNEISAIIARSIKGGFTTDQISEVFASTLAEYEAAEEKTEE